jgi:hypothetical protein
LRRAKNVVFIQREPRGGYRVLQCFDKRLVVFFDEKGDAPEMHAPCRKRVLEPESTHSALFGKRHDQSNTSAHIILDFDWAERKRN